MTGPPNADARAGTRAGGTNSSGLNHHSGRWRQVSKASPCPACGKPDWCAWSPDGALLKCERCTDARPGLRKIQDKDGGALFALDNGHTRRRRSPERDTAARAGQAVEATRSRIDWAAEDERCQTAITDQQVADLADDLGVSITALRSVGIGWATRADLERLHAGGKGWQDDPPDGAFTLPERDGSGRIVGLTLRAPDGRKGFPRGAKRGLIVPESIGSRSDPVLIVEGATDVAAGETLGLAAVGRPSNTGGADHLAQMLEGRRAIVAAENDAKPNGSWPGRDGAKAVAERLAGAWSEPVAWALPPADVKDVRAWLQGRVADGLDPHDAEICRAAGRELLDAILESAREAKPKKRSQSDALVDLALDRFRLGVTTDGDAFAVEREGLNVALLFRGSRDALRATLASAYRAVVGRVPNAAALADALNVLAGEAMEAESESVYLRVAEHGGSIVLDLGTADGRAVVIGPDGWEVVERSPVLFRRTALTGAMPEPKRGGVLNDLWDLLNVSPDDRGLVLGLLLAAFLPGPEHPIVLIGGLQDSGKTTAARFLAGLVDPSPVPTRCEPCNLHEWAVSASGSWVVALDNLSRIPGWFSDALCRACTGEGLIRRRLYSDSDLAILNFRRVVILTSIDAGALRGDLGRRMALIDLDPIDADRKRGAADLARMYAEHRPAILGALLDVLVHVLKIMPSVEPPATRGLSDFARLLTALDRVMGTDARARYKSQFNRIAEAVIDSDPVAGAVLAFARQSGTWTGRAGDLLGALTPDKAPRGWPTSPRALAGRLRRLIPALRDAGAEVVPPVERDKTRRYTLRSTAQTAQPPRIGPGDSADWVSGGAVASHQPPELPGRPSNERPIPAARGDRPPDRPTDRPPGIGPDGPANAVSDGVGGSGGQMGTVSDDGLASEVDSGSHHP